LRHVFASGEALPYSQARRFYATLPQAQLHNLYGPTEASVEVSYWDCPLAPDPRQLVPIGRPVANTQLYVLDREGEPLPVGVIGELHLGGVQLARGYLNQPQLTVERFIQHPEFGRLYRTGDLARWLPDGVVDFLGRADGQVKLRGFRIELGEIEAQLKALPEVTEAVAALRERTPGEPLLVAWVAPRPGEGCAADQLAAALATRLPDYMIPQVFVTLADFPRLTSGKINRAALPDPFTGLAAARAGHETPHAGVESELAGLWREILNQVEVGRGDRFLDLGGHSLLAVRLAGRIEQRFDIRLPLRSIMMESLAGLARQLPGGGQPAMSDAGPGPEGSGVRNEAFFFGPENRQLFGVLSLPAERRKRTAVLICTSWGPEYMRTYRALNLFAERLAQAGYPTLRFDYVATGDSAGYSVEAGLDEWLDNIATAAAELQRRSGTGPLCLVGLRLGALLAERAVEDGLDVSRLVLWDPPPDGQAWLAGFREFDSLAHENLNSQRARHVRLPPVPVNQLLGVPITEDFQRAIEGLGKQPRSERTARLLVLSADVQPTPGIADVLSLPTLSHWCRLSWVNTPWNPAAAIQIVVRKLAELLP
jgi:thioesterase domain-containing protein